MTRLLRCFQARLLSPHYCYFMLIMVEWTSQEKVTRYLLGRRIYHSRVGLNCCAVGKLGRTDVKRRLEDGVSCLERGKKLARVK